MASNASSLGDKPDPADKYAVIFKINANYLTQKFADSVRAGIEGKGENSVPFPHFQLFDFIEDAELVQHLRSELLQARYFRNDNDLNSISQTIDLKSFDIEKFPYLCGFKRFMSTTVRAFMKNITGFELNTQLALTGSNYLNTDLLLPHDDSLDYRKIAFVLYLTPDWKEEYGGALSLYSADLETNRPASIAKNLMPVYNSLSFFPVATNTWHSVQEVLSTEHQRLSLNGWFHADDAKAAAPPIPEPPVKKIRPVLETTLDDVQKWINPSYIAPSEQKSIKRRFAAKSEISLESFLNAEMYNEALKELQDASFKMTGPPDRRNVGILNESTLKEGSQLAQLLKLFRSEAMALLLTQWSGLKIYDMKKLDDSSPSAKKPRLSGDQPSLEDPSTSANSKNEVSRIKKDVEMVSNIYRLEHGSYTMSDSQMAADAASNGYCLDLLLFFGELDDLPMEAGGYVSYFAVGDANESLRVPPRSNCLAIVFREPEVLNFIKYINLLAKSKVFYLLSCSYFGASDGDETEDSLTSEDEDCDDFGLDEEFEEDEHLSDVPSESGN